MIRFSNFDESAIKEEVEDWNDIICIDSGSDYLIGYDGKNIYGVGNNYYEQFKKDINNCMYEDIMLPERKTENSAGYDFLSSFDF